MSNNIYDIDERLYELYLTDCQMNEVKPSIKDFLVWCEEQDYDLPEIWEGFEREATDAY